MPKTYTLKQLGNNLKKANKALDFHRSTSKGEETETIKQIKKIIGNIELEVASRTNPSNAVRSSLPKKKQRELGMLAPVGYVAEEDDCCHQGCHCETKE